MLNNYIVDVTDFNPKHIFECGQCFRWISQGEGRYTGIAGKHLATVYLQDPNTLVIENCTQETFHSFWKDYFDLERDYGSIKQILSGDPILKEAIAFGSGIRLLKQGFQETLFSFILSSNNRIPRIMNLIDTVSRLYGETIGDSPLPAHAFPSAGKLASLTEEEIGLCKAGYRGKYILQTAKALSDAPLPICKECASNCNAADPLCKKALLTLSGIGPKVADCILLFSGSDYTAFPTDVWVKRVMEKLYFKREASMAEIADFARDNWGEYAGFAQQYLFYWARENGIG